MDRKNKKNLMQTIFADLPINREIPKKSIHTKIDLAITNLWVN